MLVYNSSRPSLIRRVFPDAVALGEQANLSIVGANFFPAARPKCRFAGYTAADAARFTAATSAASLAHDGTMRCLAPAARSAVTVGLTLSFDGGAHFGASAVPLTLFDPLAPAHVFSVTPPYAEAHTPVRVTLHGSNLAPSRSSDPDALLCRFGERIVPARFETGASLTCASPLGS